MVYNAIQHSIFGLKLCVNQKAKGKTRNLWNPNGHLHVDLVFRAEQLFYGWEKFFAISMQNRKVIRPFIPVSVAKMWSKFIEKDLGRKSVKKECSAARTTQFLYQQGFFQSYNLLDFCCKSIFSSLYFILINITRGFRVVTVRTVPSDTFWSEMYVRLQMYASYRRMCISITLNPWLWSCFSRLAEYKNEK